MLFITLLFISFLSHGFSKPVEYDDNNAEEDRFVHYLKRRIDRKRAETRLPENGELFEGDMIMDKRLRRNIKDVESKRSALTDTSYKWPNGVIPFELDKSLVPKVYIGILKAIKEYNKYTCIKFIKRTDEEDYVLFKSEPHKCSSNVGKTGGRQIITLGTGCSRIGTILHEMMHALGIVHEQSRPDRDEHVIVRKENIKKKFLHNFQKYHFEDVRNLDVPYNYASVMHYRNTAFSRNGEPTLIARNNPGLHFGQREMFSVGDITQINRLYNCYSPTSKLDKQDNFAGKTLLNPIPNVFDTDNGYF